MLLIRATLKCRVSLIVNHSDKIQNSLHSLIIPTILFFKPRKMNMWCKKKVSLHRCKKLETLLWSNVNEKKNPWQFRTWPLPLWWTLDLYCIEWNSLIIIGSCAKCFKIEELCIINFIWWFSGRKYKIYNMATNFEFFPWHTKKNGIRKKYYKKQDSYSEIVTQWLFTYFTQEVMQDPC